MIRIQNRNMSRSCSRSRVRSRSKSRSMHLKKKKRNRSRRRIIRKSSRSTIRRGSRGRSTQQHPRTVQCQSPIYVNQVHRSSKVVICTIFVHIPVL